MGITSRTGTPSEDRAVRQGEARLPAAIAIACAIALSTALPHRLIVGPRLLAPVLEGLLLVALVVANPRRMNRENQALRVISVILILLIALTNAVALGGLVHALLSGQHQQSSALLLAACQVWVTNLIVFAVAYWELDRGGPVRRSTTPRVDLGPADFRFSQDEDHDAVSEVAAGSSKASGWIPSFVDYLYVSCTNSTAFSPTDTMPLSHRAKLLMTLQAVVAMLITLLILARAVNQLQ